MFFFQLARQVLATSDFSDSRRTHLSAMTLEVYQAWLSGRYPWNSTSSLASRCGETLPTLPSVVRPQRILALPDARRLGFSERIYGSQEPLAPLKEMRGVKWMQRPKDNNGIQDELVNAPNIPCADLASNIRHMP